MSQGQARRRTFQALKNRNYRLLWTGLIVSNIGAWMQAMAQGWVVLNLTGRASDIGLVALMRAIPLIAFSLFGGALADFLDRRKLLYVTQSLQGLFAAILGMLVLTGNVQVYHVYIISMLSAAALAFDQPARQSLIPIIVSKDELMNALVLNSIAYQGSTMFGPLLTGLLVPYIGLGGCFIANGVSFGAVIIALARMNIPVMIAAKRTRSLWHDVTRGVYEMREDKRILALVLMSMFLSFFGRGYNTYMPVFASEILHVGLREQGFLMSGPGIGTIVVSLTVASLGAIGRKGRLILCTNFLFPLCLIAFVWSSNFAMSYVILMLVGAMQTLSQTMTNTSVQLICRNEVRGRITSLFTLTSLAAMPLGQAPLGFLISAIGPSPAVTVFSGIVILATAMVLLRIPHIWRME